MNKVIYVAIVVMMCSLSSCSFHRRVAGKRAKRVEKSNDSLTLTAASATPVPDTAAKAPDTAALTRQLMADLTPLWNRRLDYKTFSGKAKVHFEGPDKDVEFSANIRIRKDSAMWVMITALGGMYQVARIYITPDSFFMINYQEKEITRIPLTEAAKVLPTKIDFASMQNLVTGDPLRNGTIINASAFGGSWSLDVADSSYLQSITYNRADSTLRTGQLRTRKADGPQAMIQYGNYEMNGGKKVSTSRVVHLQNGADVYSIDMNFSSMDFDVPVEFPFSIPKSYKLKKP